MKPVMCFETETPLQAEARLRTALRSAQVEILPLSYMWRPCAEAPASISSNDQSIAMMRTEEGWCQLGPASRSAKGDKWVLARLDFDPGAPVDGFVDWFAAQLRRRLQSRLLVATANSGPRHFAYWGVPERFRDALGRELAILASTPRTGTRLVGLL